MDINIRNQVLISVSTLMCHYRHGAYRVIKDPEGVVSLWAIDGIPNAPFSLSFVDRGRVYNNINDVPEHVLKSFIDYVRRSVK